MCTKNFELLYKLTLKIYIYIINIYYICVIIIKNKIKQIYNIKIIFKKKILYLKNLKFKIKKKKKKKR